jgi:REP element-mobilizing transposase RayT
VSKGTTSYRVKDESGMYFLTFATVNWIDVFTRKECRDILVDSIRHCQENKGLLLYSWCLMSNHIHLITRAKEGCKLSSIMRDIKNMLQKK